MKTRQVQYLLFIKMRIFSTFINYYIMYSYIHFTIICTHNININVRLSMKLFYLIHTSYGHTDYNLSISFQKNGNFYIKRGRKIVYNIILYIYTHYIIDVKTEKPRVVIVIYKEKYNIIIVSRGNRGKRGEKNKKITVEMKESRVVLYFCKDVPDGGTRQR